MGWGGTHNYSWAAFSSLKWDNNDNYLIKMLRITWDNAPKVLSMSGLKKHSETVSCCDVHNT